MSRRSRISRPRLALLTALLFTVSSAAQQKKPVASESSPLAQARAQVAKHNLDAAEAYIWQILSGHPDNVEALLMLGVVRADQQRYSEAETLFQRVVQLDPKSASAHENLGKTYLAENRLPDAIEQYREAEEFAPNDVEVHATLARLYAANGEFASAMTSLDAIPAARLPKEAVPVKTACLLALGRKTEALKLANQATDPSVQLALAEVMAASSLPQEALKLLSAAGASGKRPPARFYFVKAKALDAEGKEAAAVENFQKAIAADPAAEEYRLDLAELYARQNNHAQAFAVLQDAYKQDADSPKILRPLIVEASLAGKSAEVQDAAEKLAAKSDEPQDLFVAANVFLTTVRQNEAVPLLEKYLAKVPDDARAWVGLGVGYEDQKRFADAQKAFEKAIAVDPKSADAEYQLGVLISLSGNSAAAIQHYEHAIELDPNHAAALEKLGNLYTESSQFEKARDLLLKAELVDPGNRQVEYGLALVYSKLGNREEARIHMDRFQKAGPIGATEKKEQ